MSTTTPEQILIRVESAMHQAGRDEMPLASQWRECCQRWGPESGAARGVLLELVREAWGESHPESCVSLHGDGSCSIDYPTIRGSDGAAFDDLVAALEAGQS